MPSACLDPSQKFHYVIYDVPFSSFHFFFFFIFTFIVVSVSRTRAKARDIRKRERDDAESRKRAQRAIKRNLCEPSIANSFTWIIKRRRSLFSTLNTNFELALYILSGDFYLRGDRGYLRPSKVPHQSGINERKTRNRELSARAVSSPARTKIAIYT